MSVRKSGCTNRRSALAPGRGQRHHRAPTLKSWKPADVPASLWISDVTVLEGDSGTQNAAVVVSLSEPSNKTVTVNYRTANGTAIAGSDYDAVSGKLTFARGETSKTILIPVRGDRLAEHDERFFVNLQSAKGATIADPQGTVTITDELAATQHQQRGRIRKAAS